MPFFFFFLAKLHLFHDENWAEEIGGGGGTDRQVEELRIWVAEEDGITQHFWHDGRRRKNMTDGRLDLLSWIYCTVCGRYGRKYIALQVAPPQKNLKDAHMCYQRTLIKLGYKLHFANYKGFFCFFKWPALSID